MKILLVNKYHFIQGGADRAYLDMADILMRAGHEVAFFSMHHPKNLPTKWDKYFVSNVDYNGNKIASIFAKARAACRIMWNGEAERNMERLIREFQPDIAHLHNIYHQLSPSILRPLRRSGVPVVMTLHDYKLISPNYNLFVRGNIWEETKNGKYWTGVRDRCIKDSYVKSLVCTVEAYLHRWIGAYDSVRLFLSPSHFLIEKFLEFDFSKKMAYLPNPLVPFPKEESFASIAENSPFVFIGRLSAEKGIEKILTALKGLDGFSTLHIVGDGPERANLEAFAKKLGISDRVIFCGHLSGIDLERERRRARAVLLSSLWYENMPYALTEALGSGAIVIAARRGGIPERIRDNENGFLFDPVDERSLIEKMRHVQTLSVTLLDDIRKSARESIMDLREEIFLKKIEKVYTGLMKTLTK